ncbi:MAG: 50S ribosomal protein L7/L12 [Christensenellaceae bacterium]|jgi:large subunit ribosomal protein L7/L12|nr:50S ribosomal protein L7/L12 [Christensenellaceae bacterium]
MADIKKLVDEIEKLTLVEASELVKALEKQFGVSAAAVAVAAGPAAPAAGAAPAEAAAAKSEFDLFLKASGENKIQVIKVVKEITGLGLGDAKAIVDGAPKMIKEKVPAADAKNFEKQLKDAGATVELK